MSKFFKTWPGYFSLSDIRLPTLRQWIMLQLPNMPHVMINNSLLQPNSSLHMASQARHNCILLSDQPMTNTAIASLAWYMIQGLNAGLQRLAEGRHSLTGLNI